MGNWTDTTEVGSNI